MSRFALWGKIAGFDSSIHRRVLVPAVVLLSILLIGIGAARADLILQNTDCWSCHGDEFHRSYGLEYIDCDMCHEAHDYWGVNQFEDIGEGDHDWDGYDDCTWCHNPSWPVPQHTAESLDGAHLTTVGFEAECALCHDPNLMTEHPDACAACHSSTDPDVQAVVADWDRSCSACHAGYAQSHSALHESAEINGLCVGEGCHESNLVVEHGDECAPCHDTTTWYVVAAVEAGDLTCTACHTLYHYKGSSQDPYMSWEDAELSMQLREVDSGGTPHGGYTANTTKCAVCHSVHRAASDRTEDGVGSYWKLTPGGDSCVTCHTASGSNPTAKLVEWPSTYDDGGPHRSFQCMGQCHAGVHGAIASEYAAAARFLLNPNRRAERPEMGGVGLDGGLEGALATGNVKTDVVDATTLNTDFDLLTADQQGANRAMVTGYLCGQAGCHTSSQFAVNVENYAEMRVSMPSDPYGPYDVAFTGHSTSFNSNHCASSGCHQVAWEPADSKCAACHDFRGRVTNSSAWPHANRSIEVYEWIRPTGYLETTFTPVVSGNLWMYYGDVTFRDADGIPTSTVMWDGLSGPGITHGTEVDGFSPGRINTRTVLEDNAGFDDINNKPGNIRDGVCIKCHGFTYWPYHGVDSFQNPDSNQFDRNFANY